jgi:tetratricopeptide (TPR) repeat protein
MEPIAKVLKRIWEYFSNNLLISGFILIILGLFVPHVIKVFIPIMILMKANKLLHKGYLDRAKELFTKILKKYRDNNPVRNEAYDGRAETSLRQKKYERSIKDAKKSIKINVENGNAYCIIGRAYSLLGDYIKAFKYFNEALEHSTKEKDNEDSYFYRGIEYFVQKNYDQAIADFNLVLKKRPKLIAVLIYRAFAFFRKEENDLAIKDCNTLLEMRPELDFALVLRGHAYMAKDNYKQAVKDYTEALKIKPQNAEYHSYRANAYYDIKEYDHAIADYTKAIEKYRKEAKYYYNRGCAYCAQKKFDQAIADYTKALENDQDFERAYKGRVYNNRGCAYDEKGNFKLANADYKKAMEINPNDEKAKSNYDYINMTNKRITKPGQSKPSRYKPI